MAPAPASGPGKTRDDHHRRPVHRAGAGRAAASGERTRPLWRAVPDESPYASIARLLAFAVLAAALQRRWRKARRTLVAVGALAVVLYAGKIFVEGRHAALADVLLSVAGGLAGSLIGSRIQRLAAGDRR